MFTCKVSAGQLEWLCQRATVLGLTQPKVTGIEISPDRMGAYTVTMPYGVNATDLMMPIPREEKGTMDAMNYSTAVFLINQNCRAIACTYDKDEASGKAAPRTIFKTFNPAIKVDDFVVIPTGTRHNMTVVKVVEVDVEPDLDSSVEMQWIIGVIDASGFNDTLTKEADAIAKIKSAQKLKKRKELADAMLADMPDTDVKLLPIATIDH